MDLGIKDFILYSAKKMWMILFAVAVISAAIVFSCLYIARPVAAESYKSEAVFCTMEAYASERPEIMDQNSQAAEAVYRDAVYRTVNLMASERVKNDFYFKANALFNSLYSPSSHRDDFTSELKNNFVVNADGANFSVEIKGGFSNEEERTAAKSLLSLYMDSALNAVGNEIPTNLEFLTVFAPIKTIDMSADDFNILNTIGLSIFTGIVLAVITAAAVFSLDPRVKSFSQISEEGGEFLGQTRGKTPDGDAVNYICAKSSEDKILFMSSGSGDAFAAEMAKSVTNALVAVGLKILFIDLCKIGQEADNTLLGLYNGEKIKQGASFDTVYANSDEDWMMLLKDNGKIFDGLKDKYDKIIIAYAKCDGAVLLGRIADKTIVVFNMQSAKMRDVKKLITEVRQTPVFGTYIYNAT